MAWGAAGMAALDWLYPAADGRTMLWRIGGVFCGLLITPLATRGLSAIAHYVQAEIQSRDTAYQQALERDR